MFFGLYGMPAVGGQRLTLMIGDPGRHMGFEFSNPEVF